MAIPRVMKKSNLRVEDKDVTSSRGTLLGNL